VGLIIPVGSMAILPVSEEKAPERREKPG